MLFLGIAFLLVVLLVWLEYRHLVEIRGLGEVSGHDYSLNRNVYFLVVAVRGKKFTLKVDKGTFHRYVRQRKIPVGFKITSITKRIIQVRPRLE